MRVDEGVGLVKGGVGLYAISWTPQFPRYAGFSAVAGRDKRRVPERILYYGSIMYGGGFRKAQG